jgi:phosphoribosylamine--glycine ligase
MLTPDGPKIIEYNVRFGDPEAQVVLPRITSDLTALLAEAAEGDVHSTVTFADDAAVTVVCSVEGYPTAPRAGDLIDGMRALSELEGVKAYCAGVAMDDHRRLVTAGGRVLSVTALGRDLGEARAHAYDGVSKLSWPGMHYRTDVGLVT